MFTLNMCKPLLSTISAHQVEWYSLTSAFFFPFFSINSHIHLLVLVMMFTTRNVITKMAWISLESAPKFYWDQLKSNDHQELHPAMHIGDTGATDTNANATSNIPQLQHTGYKRISLCCSLLHQTSVSCQSIACTCRNGKNHKVSYEITFMWYLLNLCIGRVLWPQRWVPALQSSTQQVR